jgi:hypothetical protein
MEPGGSGSAGCGTRTRAPGGSSDICNMGGFSRGDGGVLGRLRRRCHRLSRRRLTNSGR